MFLRARRTKKQAIFRPPLHQMGAWRGLKWPNVMFSHGLGGDMAQKTVSRWISLPGTSLPTWTIFAIKD